VRTLGFLFVAALSTPARLLAQDSSTTVDAGGATCYRARPKPACSVFFLTDAGGYLSFQGSNSAQPVTRFRAAADWGFMANLGQHSAAGASFFVLLDNVGFVAGPSVRYRRWLRRGASLDLALGTPVHASVNSVSVYGLVKWSPVHWFGVAARPELVRRTTQSHAQFSVGVEVGWVPGMVLTVVSSVVGAIILAIVAAQGD
jgi:hypothetical protein